MRKLKLLFMLLALLTIPNGLLAWSGSGSADAPYQISTASDLATLATNVNGGTNYSGKYFKLMNDISLSGYSNWTPIGKYNYYFCGTFDGNNKTISNLTINASYHTNGCGLFGGVGSGGMIKNLTVSGSVTMASTTQYSSNVGGIVGRLYCGTVQNCTNNCNVTAGRQVGGVVGLQTGTITGCTNNGTVTATSAYSNGDACAVGGIAGVMADDGYSTFPNKYITNCINNGAVNGSSIGFYAGGIVGDVNNYNGSRSNLYVQNCQNYGTITASQRGIAGCIGYVRQASNSANISGNYNNGKIYAQTGYSPAYIGIIVGNENGSQSGGTYGSETAIYINNVEQSLSSYISGLGTASSTYLTSSLKKSGLLNGLTVGL